jgi:uncharacterized membrane protein
MAEPTTTVKTALAAAAIASLGPVIGQHALIIAGAFGGALIALMAAEPMRGWWPPVRHVLQGLIAAIVSTSALAQVASAMAPKDWGLSPDLLWVPMAAVVAALWREGLGVLRRLVSKQAGGTGTNGGGEDKP